LNKRIIWVSLIVLNVFFIGIGLNNFIKNNVIFDTYQFSNEKDGLNGANGEFAPVIVYFNTSSYNIFAETRFMSYGGIINNDRKWNGIFNEFSGFAGIFPLENISEYKAEFSDINIDRDEVLEVQMNYAAIQSQAVNSTWSLNGYTGDTNSSIALLDSGIILLIATLYQMIMGMELFSHPLLREQVQELMILLNHRSQICMAIIPT